MRRETIAIPSGYEVDPTTKSVAVPIYQTAAYAFDSADHGAALFNLSPPEAATAPRSSPLAPRSSLLAPRPSLLAPWIVSSAPIIALMPAFFAARWKRGAP